MTDFLGRELNIGDKVVALSHKRTSSTLYLGEIEKLTSKMVAIKTVGSKHDWRYGEIMHVSPYKVVKVDIDAVPVVRCKDCRYRFTSLCPTHSVEYDMENEPDIMFGLDGENDFCSFGQRK